MKVTTRSVPTPPPPKTFVLELSQKEANLVYTLLIYFGTLAPRSGNPINVSGSVISRLAVYELPARRKLQDAIGANLRDALGGGGAKMIFGMNGD